MNASILDERLKIEFDIKTLLLRVFNSKDIEFKDDLTDMKLVLPSKDNKEFDLLLQYSWCFVSKDCDSPMIFKDISPFDNISYNTISTQKDVIFDSFRHSPLLKRII